MSKERIYVSVMFEFLSFLNEDIFHPWKAALTRISEAKKEAEKAKDNAQQARDKALDILSQVNKIEIPNLDLEQLGLTGSRTDGTQNIEKIAKEIENEADVLEHKLEVLLNEFDSKKQRLENRYDFRY